MKVDEDHSQMGPHSLMDGQHRVMDQTLHDEGIAPCGDSQVCDGKRYRDEPAFCWWVPNTHKKTDAIIFAVNTRVRKVTHKYGIKIPTGVEHAKELDR